MIVDIEQPTLEGGRPRPIRGWLILIAVVLILTLVRLGWGLLHAIDALDAAGWNPAVAAAMRSLGKYRSNNTAVSFRRRPSGLFMARFPWLSVERVAIRKLGSRDPFPETRRVHLPSPSSFSPMIFRTVKILMNPPGSVLMTMTFSGRSTRRSKFEMVPSPRLVAAAPVQSRFTA